MKNPRYSRLGVAVNGIDHLLDRAQVLVLANALLEHVLFHLSGITGYGQVWCMLPVSCQLRFTESLSLFGSRHYHERRYLQSMDNLVAEALRRPVFFIHFRSRSARLRSRRTFPLRHKWTVVNAHVLLGIR